MYYHDIFWRDVIRRNFRSTQCCRQAKYVRKISQIFKPFLNCIYLRNMKKIYSFSIISHPLHWRHNDHDGVSNHQPHGCLLNRLFRWRSKKTSKLRVTGLCVGNSPGTGEFPAQSASYAENVAIWWRHHALRYHVYGIQENVYHAKSIPWLLMTWRRKILRSQQP